MNRSQIWTIAIDNKSWILEQKPETTWPERMEGGISESIDFNSGTCVEKSRAL